MKTATFLTVSAISFIALLCPELHAQQSLDFATALEFARKNNPDWRAAEQELENRSGKINDSSVNYIVASIRSLKAKAGRGGFPAKELARIMAWVFLWKSR